ncbi:DUF4189 domain-containing protein [Amphritea sp.]|uniref:DUF4189 domain-containing protein n=1 Tax=Amphritea sp. TaxID=1872502 RepID=UPI0025BB5D39|nr:DUF4189 domain-containing protein [Amphritea sp.]
MKIIKTITVIVSITFSLLSSLALSEEKDHWAALAIGIVDDSDGGDNFGWSSGYGYEREVKASALKGCRKNGYDCKIRHTTQRCFAVYARNDHDGDAKWHRSTRDTLSEAKRAARSRCRDRDSADSGCEKMVAVCADD